MICKSKDHNTNDCPVTCQLCTKKGHLAKDCLSHSPKKCKSCQSTDHKTKDCQVNKTSCQLCIAGDHLANQCPFCDKCKEYGHKKGSKPINLAQQAFALSHQKCHCHHLGDINKSKRFDLRLQCVIARAGYSNLL